MEKSSLAPKKYEIKEERKIYFKIFLAVFLIFWICAVALMIATLCYDTHWQLITAFVFIAVTIVLPISILLLCNFKFYLIIIHLKIVINLY